MAAGVVALAVLSSGALSSNLMTSRTFASASGVPSALAIGVGDAAGLVMLRMVDLAWSSHQYGGSRGVGYAYGNGGQVNGIKAFR